MLVARLLRPVDRAFVACTWVRSFADYAPWASTSRTRKEHGAIVDRILAAPVTRTMLLCSDVNENALHAWACGTRAGTLHYVYVPPELRGHGLARRVISAVLGEYPDHIAVTHPWPRHSTRFRWDLYPLLSGAQAGAADGFRDAA